MAHRYKRRLSMAYRGGGGQCPGREKIAGRRQSARRRGILQSLGPTVGLDLRLGSPYCPKRYDEKLGTPALNLPGRVSSRTRHLLPVMKRLPKNLRGTASATARSARVANTPI